MSKSAIASITFSSVIVVGRSTLNERECDRLNHFLSVVVVGRSTLNERKCDRLLEGGEVRSPLGLCYIPGISSCLSCLLLLLFFLLLDFFAVAFALSLSSLILSNNTDAGSSLGSWGTSSPRNALANMD